MAPSPAKISENGSAQKKGAADSNTATYAAFSPSQAFVSPATRQRSTILVHKKSPLLEATPPSVTRVLAFSHPFILPLNKFVGLLSWTSGDPWESFLLVAGFWAVTLYGDIVTRYAGPLMLVVLIILGMYSRRYSPLSSTGWTGEKSGNPSGKASEGTMKHQKGLDEIVDTLAAFTSRCNALLQPLLQLTDFLSTQQSATSATTKPALTSMFIRLLFLLPLWIILSMPPIGIITTRRVVITIGTLVLSWHSRPARVSRTILWRSLMVRHIASIITGLALVGNPQTQEQSISDAPPLPPRRTSNHVMASAMANKGAQSIGVRFTFVVFENQRRWLGLGWTNSLLAYERAVWTDEHLNPSDPKDDFHLPEISSGDARWRWTEGSEWRVEGSNGRAATNEADGWIYYDNKWNDGRRGQDGWGRYTRRRKWYRDAELVEVSDADVNSSVATLVPDKTSQASMDGRVASSYAAKVNDDSSSIQARKRGWFRRGSRGSRSSGHSTAYSGTSTLDDEGEDHKHPIRDDPNTDWGVGDDLKMSLG
ncbi:MAG: hypothetical protein LQ342_003565 [Letrouitia transgressa]|nr:MAG: hypothetical protein LQ342_003565 [Letrouitia transgressa]